MRLSVRAESEQSKGRLLIWECGRSLLWLAELLPLGLWATSKTGGDVQDVWTSYVDLIMCLVRTLSASLSKKESPAHGSESFP